MADQQFPGFEGDDEAKKPAKPAAPSKPGTGKVTKAGGEPPILQSAGKVDYAFEESAEEPAPKKKAAPPPSADTVREPTPATMQPVIGEKGDKGKTPSRTQQAAQDEVDAELKPGSRKDLWNCPHCGAGNKPGRDTCRTCGKSPDDPLEIPWFKKPAIIGGAVGGVVLLIVIIVLCGGTDLSAKPAEAGAIDSKPRIGGSASDTHEVATRTFTAKKKFSVVGRCLGSQASSSVDGTTTVVLLLGKAARGDLPADVSVTFNGDITDVPSAPGKFIIVHLLSGKTEYKKGDILSITGDIGEFADSSWGSAEYTVWPESVQVGH